MDSLTTTESLRFNPNTLDEVRRDVNLHRPGEMKEAVRILHEWIQQQPHFRKKDFPASFLESSIVSSKGSLERAKKLIDRMCTMRTLMPRYFGSYDVREGYQQHLKDRIYVLTLPNLTKENHRIHIVKIIEKKLNYNIFETVYKQVYACFDCLKIRDYNSGIIIVLDLSDVDLQNILRNFNFSELNTLFDICLEGYGFRLKRIHLITSSTLVSALVNFCTNIFNKKIFDRLHINKTPGELLQYYPEDILPKEYGGSNRTINELNDACMEELFSDLYLEYIKSMNEATVDESLRPRGQLIDMYAEMRGTFRSLNLD